MAWHQQIEQLSYVGCPERTVQALRDALAMMDIVTGEVWDAVSFPAWLLICEAEGLLTPYQVDTALGFWLKPQRRGRHA